MENPSSKEEYEGLKILREIKEKLNLKKPVQFYPNNNLNTLRCYVDRMKDIYIIEGPEYFLEEPKCGHDVVHELCHFHLAETIDPLFASAYLEKEPDSADFQERIKAFYFASRFEDMWINDVMQHVTPEIHKQGILETWSYVKCIIDACKHKVLLSNNELILGIAMNIAERKRHKIEEAREIEKNILKVLSRRLGKKWVRMVQRMSDFFASLPRLPEDSKEALKIYETSIQHFIEMNNYPITATIIENEDSEDTPHVWRVRWKE
jgi:hypothetical protein